jgi:hypothetical protein
MNSHMYEYSKDYYHIPDGWTSMLSAMYSDTTWLAKSAQGSWHYRDNVISNGYKRTWTFGLQEDRVAFILVCGDHI